MPTIFNIILSVYVAVIILNCCSAKTLPNFLQKCTLNYPEINACIKEQLVDLKPYLAKGIPELKIPSLDPFLIPKIELQTGNRTSGQFTASFKNIVVEGLKDAKIEKIDFNFEKKKFDVSIYVPKIYVRTQYNVNGKLLLLQIDSSGPGFVNITDVRTEMHCNLGVIIKHKKQYLNIPHNTINMTYTKIRVRFEKLFKGNDELTEHTNAIINDNIVEIQKEMKPLIDDTVNTLAKSLITQFLDNYSIDELFII